MASEYRYRGDDLMGTVGFYLILEVGVPIVMKLNVN